MKIVKLKFLTIDDLDDAGEVLPSIPTIKFCSKENITTVVVGSVRRSAEKTRYSSTLCVLLAAKVIIRSTSLTSIFHLVVSHLPIF